MATHDTTRAAEAAHHPTLLGRIAAALHRAQVAFRRSLRHLRQAPVATRAAQRRAGGARAAGAR